MREPCDDFQTTKGTGDRVNVQSMTGSHALSRTGSACVYTTLIGDYEKLIEQPLAASSSLPFICLTDDPNLRSGTWQIRHVKPLFGMDPIRSQRALKLRPHEHLPSFEASLYIDNAVLLKIKPEQLIDRSLADSGFCLPEHSFRETLLDEFLEVEAHGLDDPGRIFEQLNHYAMEFPELLEERPYWTGILLRDHRNPRVRTMLDLWYAHVQRYSRRDQLSINVALKETGLCPEVLHIDNYNSAFHTWPHQAMRIRKKRVWLGAEFSHPARIKGLERQIRKLAVENDLSTRLCMTLGRVSRRTAARTRHPSRGVGAVRAPRFTDPSHAVGQVGVVRLRRSNRLGLRHRLASQISMRRTYPF